MEDRIIEGRRCYRGGGLILSLEKTQWSLLTTFQTIFLAIYHDMKENLLRLTNRSMGRCLI